MNEAHALVPAIVLLTVGILAILVTRKVGMSPIVGYLLAGILVGPHALGVIQESRTTHLLAELGVVFLLFDIGMHFSISTIWEARRDIFGLGPLQIILCTAVFSGIAVSFGMASEFAIIVGCALALSSTAVVIHTLSERGQRNCPVGLTGTAVLIFQDICAIFLLILAASLGEGGGGGASSDPGLSITIAIALAKTVVAFLAALIIGRHAISPLFQLFSQTKNEEVFTATALLVVLATAAATGGAGLSLTLGAFLGGMIISETPYRHVIQTEAKPFRDLLLGFFFITVGMSLDWRILFAQWAEIILFLVALIAIKSVLIAAAARAFGWSTPGAVQLGFLLFQGSEFVFVIVAMPVVREALGDAAAGVIITGVAASLVLTPGLASFGNRLARRLRQKFYQIAPAKETQPRVTTAPVLVFGLGEVGRSVADALEVHGLAYDAIEDDYDRFLAASADGYPVAFGNAGDIRMMEAFAFSERKAIVITIDRRDALEALHGVMLERYPDLACFIAVDSDDEKSRFDRAGLKPVVGRSIPRGLDLAAAVLRYLQVQEPEVQDWMRRYQERVFEDSPARAVQQAV